MRFLVGLLFTAVVGGLVVLLIPKDEALVSLTPKGYGNPIPIVRSSWEDRIPTTQPQAATGPQLPMPTQKPNIITEESAERVGRMMGNLNRKSKPARHARNRTARHKAKRGKLARK